MTDVTVNILGAASHSGGRRTVSSSYSTKAWVSWDMAKFAADNRIMGSGAVAEINIICHPEIPILDPEFTRIVIDNVTYKPVDVINDNLRIFGKTGHYHFFLSEVKEAGN